jgi:hypoxanthine phosphoribosyltransferase
MDFVELSIKSLENLCKNWALEVKKEFNADLVIYIAKGGYLVAKPFSDIFNVPLIGVKAERKGNKVKDLIMPLIVKLPNFVLNILRKIELKTNIHDKYTERNIVLFEELNSIDKNSIKNILIVDDSVDTGYTMKLVVDKINEVFEDVNVKTAAINVWKKSGNIIKTNFYLYEDTIIRTPMSKDSKEYKIFLKIYKEK